MYQSTSDTLPCPKTRTRGHHPSNPCLDTTADSIIAATYSLGWLFVGFPAMIWGHHSHCMSVLGIPQESRLCLFVRLFMFFVVFFIFSVCF